MTLNRLSPTLKQKFINMQQLYDLAERSKNNKRFYYWDSHRYQSLMFSTISFRVALHEVLSQKNETIVYMRYVFKLPIATIMERTGYCKRSVLYHLKQSIQKLEEYENADKGLIFYSAI